MLPLAEDCRRVGCSGPSYPVLAVFLDSFSCAVDDRGGGLVDPLGRRRRNR